MSSVSNNKRRTWLGKLGTTSLEFAFILPWFLWLLLGTIDIARYLYTVQALIGLMGEAGRLAIMNPIAPPPGTEQIATIAPLLDANQVTLTVTQTSYNLYTVTVQVQYQFVAYTPLLGGLSGPITESTTYTY
jgi:Flp pilus assembly protein TadG